MESRGLRKRWTFHLQIPAVLFDRGQLTVQRLFYILGLPQPDGVDLRFLRSGVAYPSPGDPIEHLVWDWPLQMDNNILIQCPSFTVLQAVRHAVTKVASAPTGSIPCGIVHLSLEVYKGSNRLDELFAPFLPPPPAAPADQAQAFEPSISDVPAPKDIWEAVPLVSSVHARPAELPAAAMDEVVEEAVESESEVAWDPEG